MKKLLTFFSALLFSFGANGGESGSLPAEDKELQAIFKTFAGLFTGEVRDEMDIAAPKEIDRSKLDYSLESLKELDKYLSYLHKNKESLNDKELENSVLWGGAYLGEVIRKKSKNLYVWESYKSYMERNKDLSSSIQYGFTTKTLLTSGKKGATLPVNKVYRYIVEGEENNTYYYGSAER